MVIPAIFGAYIFLTKAGRNTIVKISLFFMSLGFAYLAISSGIGSFQDSSAMKEMAIGIVIMFACYYFVYMYRSIYSDEYLVRLFLDMNKVGVLHSIIVISTLISPDFKSTLYDVVAVTEKSSKYLFSDELLFNRFQGIVHSGFSSLSTTHSLLLVIGVWGFYMEKKPHGLFHVMLFIAGQILLFLSIALIGRTGFVVLVIFLGAYFLWRLTLFIENFRILKRTLYLESAIVLIVLGIFYTVNVSVYSSNINFAFEFIINWLGEGELSTVSTSQLMESEYFLPNNIVELLFGSSNFDVASDVGYVKFIFGAGVIGMLISYSFYFVGLYYAIKKWKLNKDVSMFIVLYFAMIIVLNFKDYYFVSYSGYIQVYFLILCALGRYVDDGKYYVLDLRHTYARPMVSVNIVNGNT